MLISINTAEEISGLDKAVLSILAGGVATESPNSAPTTEKPSRETSKPKAAPKKEPVVEEEDEKEETETSSDAPTLDDAKAKASALVTNGEAAKVKAALTAVGAKKVSEIDPGKIAEFLEELEN